MKAILFCILFGSLAHADDLSLTFHLTEGMYYTAGKSTLVSHNLRLRRWGNDMLGEGSYLYGERKFPFQVTFQRQEKNLFSGKGEIEVMTDDRVICHYPTRIVVYAYQEKIFMKDFSPAKYPTSLAADGKCGEPGASQWTVHDEPYYRWPNE